MRIFISWSGDSKDVASALSDLLPRLIDDAEPFMSTEIRAGAIWLLELERELSETDFGIICLTKSNSLSRWLHYEAGALSRHVGIQREVMPVMLIDIESPADVSGPFAGFQLKAATQAEFLDIMNSINDMKVEGRKKVAEDILAERVTMHWDRMEKAIQAVKSHRVITEKRNTDSMLKEVLQIVRGLGRSTTSNGLTHIDESALSEGISNRILRKLATRDGEEGSWARFDQAVRELADRLRASYEPDFMVGVYPEGGFVGYLLWLDSEKVALHTGPGRRWLAAR